MFEVFAANLSPWVWICASFWAATWCPVDTAFSRLTLLVCFRFILAKNVKVHYVGQVRQSLLAMYVQIETVHSPVKSLCGIYGFWAYQKY